MKRLSPESLVDRPGKVLVILKVPKKRARFTFHAHPTAIWEQN